MQTPLLRQTASLSSLAQGNGADDEQVSRPPSAAGLRTPGTPSAFTVKKRKADQDGEPSSTAKGTTTRKYQNRRKKRPTDRVLPSKAEEFLMDSDVYKKLVDFEKRVDATIMRKRVDAYDALRRPMRGKRTLRLFFSSKGTNQDPESVEPPGWTMRVEGRLLDEQNVTKERRRKLSSFISRIFVELDHPQYIDKDRTVEWVRDSFAPECDGFEIKRIGRDLVKCKVLILLDNQPPQYKLAEPLAKLVGLHTANRNKIILALWEYIKMHRLLDKTDKTLVNCDAYMEIVFQTKTIDFSSIPTLISPFLLPPDPVELEYTVNPENTGDTDLCYDVEIDVEDTGDRTRALSFMQSASDQKELENLENKMVECVEEIKQAKARRDFMLGFARDPVTFIQKWIVSQHKDLKAMNDLSGNPEEERHAEFYFKPFIEEAVWKYLTEKTNERRRQLEQHLTDLKNS